MTFLVRVGLYCLAAISVMNFAGCGDTTTKAAPINCTKDKEATAECKCGNSGAKCSTGKICTKASTEAAETTDCTDPIMVGAECKKANPTHCAKNTSCLNADKLTACNQDSGCKCYAAYDKACKASACVKDHKCVKTDNFGTCGTSDTCKCVVDCSDKSKSEACTPCGTNSNKACVNNESTKDTAAKCTSSSNYCVAPSR